MLENSVLASFDETVFVQILDIKCLLDNGKARLSISHLCKNIEDWTEGRFVYNTILEVTHQFIIKLQET